MVFRYPRALTIHDELLSLKKERDAGYRRYAFIYMVLPVLFTGYLMLFADDERRILIGGTLVIWLCMMQLRWKRLLLRIARFEQEMANGKIYLADTKGAHRKQKIALYALIVLVCTLILVVANQPPSVIR